MSSDEFQKLLEIQKNLYLVLLEAIDDTIGKDYSHFAQEHENILSKKIASLPDNDHLQKEHLENIKQDLIELLF